MQVKDFFEYAFPVLLTLWAVSVISRYPSGFVKGRQGFAVIIVLSGVIALVPFSGLSLSDYLLSLNPVFSVGSIATLFILLCRRLRGVSLLTERDWIIFSLWNVIVGSLLYSSSLGLADMDLYPLGYGFSAFFVGTAIITGMLFLFKSPLSYIFIAYIAAFDLGLLLSRNFFDYMIDVILFFVSTGILIRSAILRCRKVFVRN